MVRIDSGSAWRRRPEGILATLARIRRPIATTSIVLALACAGCGSAGRTGTSHGTTRRALSAAHAAKPASLKLAYHPLFSLGAAVQDPASAALGDGRFALLGGITPAQTSTANIVVATARGPQASASLPGAQHDAQAAALGGAIYVFGGGEFTQYDHILRYDPGSNSVSAAGKLPTAESDVAVTAVGGTAYIVGGFDGNSALDTIVGWSPGAGAHVVAHLPVALRYAAVTAVGGRVLIIGGSTPNGASDAIYRFDPGSGLVHQIGRLPQPITHAGAAVLGSTVYLVGGRGDSTSARTAGVWAIDPLTGKVAPAGSLPQPLSDVGVLSLGNAIIVAGGHSADGTQAAVGELTPVS
jgi:N-acetylneuraminic acid mutarotase